MVSLNIRTHKPSELEAVLDINEQAFQSQKEPGLVADLLSDPTAIPRISLVAEQGGQLMGHILLTAVHIEGANPSPKCSLLAPLAIIPEAQGKGIGQTLVNASLKEAKEAGQHMVFVLGHPTYYPKCGFQIAGRLGFQTPYPIPEENADAWMVAELVEGAIERYSGKIIMADMLNKPEYWRE